MKRVNTERSRRFNSLLSVGDSGTFHRQSDGAGMCPIMPGSNGGECNLL